MQAQYPDFKVCNIAASQARTNVAYGTLTTPDQVQVYVPDDAQLQIAYMALWQNSAASAGRAAIFLGANQLKQANNSTFSPAAQEATGNATTGTDATLASYGGGLIGTNATSAMSEVTTGQLIGSNGSVANVGGFCEVFVAPGTYTISVQFKSASGSVTVQKRRLWVRVWEPSARA